MVPVVRKLALTTHITLSVGWIGAVMAYLVLVVAAMRSPDEQTLRAAWLAMELIAWFLIVPLALASLVTGLVMSLATPWGVFRHYWILASLGLTSIATLVLLGHMKTVSIFASMAGSGDPAAIDALRNGLQGELLHAGVGLLVLIGVEALNVYKPQGLTPYGRRQTSRAPVPHAQSAVRVTPAHARVTSTPRWGRIAGIHAAVLALLFVIAHLMGGGLPGH